MITICVICKEPFEMDDELFLTENNPFTNESEHICNECKWMIKRIMSKASKRIKDEVKEILCRI